MMTGANKADKPSYNKGSRLMVIIMNEKESKTGKV